MSLFDPAFLSRLRFVWVIAWHILLPAFTVGAASFIALLEGLHLTTRRDVYTRISMFWIKIFSIAFGMGVVTGISRERRLIADAQVQAAATALGMLERRLAKTVLRSAGR